MIPSNHLILAFDLTSTQEACHDFIHPENSCCSISVQITFEGALATNVENFFQGERSSTFYVNSERKVTKNNYHVPHRCKVMKYAIYWEIFFI